MKTNAMDRVILTWHDVGLGDLVIVLEAAFDRRLDGDRLARAFALVAEAEPVLGCVIEMRDGEPEWAPLREAPTLVEAADEAGFETFRFRRCDPRLDPMIQACRLAAPDGDRLCLVVNHTVADAGGVKEVAAIWANNYRRLGSDPDYKPVANRAGSRDIDQVFRLLTPRQKLRLAWNHVRLSRLHKRRPPLTLDLGDVRKGPMGYEIRELDADRVSAAAERGPRGITLNDWLIATHLRALIDRARWDGRRPVDLQTTVDLRRWYVPGGRAEGICNLSNFEYTDLGDQPGRDLDETLDRVGRHMRMRKQDLFGLPETALIPVMGRLSYTRLLRTMIGIHALGMRRKFFPNSLTNMGPIAYGAVDFDGSAHYARLLVPRMAPPLFGVGVSGYAGRLTLSAGVTEGTRPAVAAFMDRWMEHWPG